jgi:hypothetical protein
MNSNYAATPTEWADFNDAQAQQSGFDLMPKGTVVPVRMSIKPGGHDDLAQGWTGGYATQSLETGAVYLAGEFIVTAGPFAKRKLWSNLGLLSPKGPAWAQMGRTFIRAALNSARNVLPQDSSAQAAAARRISGFSELDGLEFVVRVDVEKDQRGDDRNVVKTVVEPDQHDYGLWSPSLKNLSTSAQTPAPVQVAHRPAMSSAPAQLVAPAQALPAAVRGKPSWAQ